MIVRIKVKHLVLSLLVLAGLGALFVYVAVPQWQLRAARQWLADDDRRGAEAALRMLTERGVTTGQKLSLIRDHMMGKAVSREGALDYELYVGPNHTQIRGEQIPDLYTLEEKIFLLSEYTSKAQRNAFYARAVWQLAECYREAGEPERAIELLRGAWAEMEPSRQSWEWKETAVALIRLLAHSEQMAEAMTQLETFVSHSNFQAQWNGELASLRVELLLSSGDVHSGVALVSARLEAGQGTGGGETEGNRRRQLEEALRLLEAERERVMSSRSTVSGTVERRDGTTLSGVWVFLRDASIVNRSVTERDRYRVRTGTDGGFSFEHVPPGSYQLFLGMKLEQMSGYAWAITSNDWIDVDGSSDVKYPVVLQPLLEQVAPVEDEAVSGDTLRFEWQPVTGAAYYRLNIGMEIENGWVSATYYDRVRDHWLELDKERLFDLRTGLVFETPGDWTTIEPAVLLGFMNPDQRYFWHVEAYDAEDRMLARSNGYRLDERSMGKLPFFRLKGRTLTDEDRLVLSGRFKEALAGYELKITERPDDVHALRMAVRLREAKRLGDDKTPMEDELLRHMQTLAELQPSVEHISRVMYAHYSRGEWKEYETQYARLVEMGADGLSSYDRANYAGVLLQQGRYAEAKEILETAVPEDRSHRFIGHYVAAVLYVNQDASEALRVARAYPLRSYGPPLLSWADLVERIQTEADASGDVLRYYKALNEKLDWHFGGDSGALSAWLLSAEYPTMKSFVQAVMGVK